MNSMKIFSGRAHPELAKRVRWGFASALIVALLLPFIFHHWTPMIALGLLMSFWVIASLVCPIRAHFFLCMLACYVEWHMRRALAPMLFQD